jgi:hypothetical protein
LTENLDSDPFARRDAARDMARAVIRPKAPGTAGTPQATAQARPSRRRGGMAALAVAALCLVLAAGLALVLLHRAPVQAPRAGTAAGEFDAAIVPADETAVLNAPQDRLGVFRLTHAPAVLVLAFPSLHEQALTLDRVGAFVEKAGMPHDRVMPDAELQTRIRQAGESFDSFYYGHDYRAADLARFFASASADGVKLDREERALKGLLQRQGMLRAGVVGAVISVPPVSADPPVDAAERATILRHEVSHGVYFTDPAYAGYTQHFWSDVMTGGQRDAFRKMLGGEGYDTSNDDLMCNEMQAYLAHTPDRRFFNPTGLGIDAADLRRRFVQGMPAGWLRDETEGRPSQ